MDTEGSKRNYYSARDELVRQLELSSLEPNWGPVGKAVYDRTYSRTLPWGDKETWLDTCIRVANGNVRLAYPDFHWDQQDDYFRRMMSIGFHDPKTEFVDLVDKMFHMRIMPGGRQIYGHGVPQFSGALNNCWVTSYAESLTRGHTFLFNEMMLGGGVGANYSQLSGEVINTGINLHFVCSESHPDFEALKAEGLISDEYTAWSGAFMVGDSREGWSEALGDMIDTMLRDDVRHSNRVYDLSGIRAAGSPIRRFGGQASGPIALAKTMRDIAAIYDGAVGRAPTPLEVMAADHAIAEGVVAGGNRRSARMSMLHWKDPFISSFIKCKQDMTGLPQWSTNLSVIVDNEFWDGVAEGDELATWVFEASIKAMAETSEPGFWNIDLAHEDEHGRLPVATNPCGEISLSPFESCNLGHLNIANIDGKVEAIWCASLMARFLLRTTLDTVNDPIANEIQNQQRRLGLGLFGVIEHAGKQGLDLRERDDLRSYFRDDLKSLRGVVEDHAKEYARELRVVAPVKFTTVAPTGTTAKLAGTTEGCQPHYSDYFIQRMQLAKGAPSTPEIIERTLKNYPGSWVEDSVYDRSGNTSVIAMPLKHPLADTDIQSEDHWTVDQHLQLLLYFQQWADNGISYTINCATPELDDRVAELRGALLRRGRGIKGITYHAEGHYPQSPKERISKERFLELTNGDGAEGDGLDDCQNGSCPIR